MGTTAIANVYGILCGCIVSKTLSTTLPWRSTSKYHEYSYLWGPEISASGLLGGNYEARICYAYWLLSWSGPLCCCTREGFRHYTDRTRAEGDRENTWVTIWYYTHCSSSRLLLITKHTELAIAHVLWSGHTLARMRGRESINWGFYGQVGMVQENPSIASNAIPIGFLSTPHSMVPKHTHSRPNKLYVLIERTQINMTLWRNSKSSNLIFSSFTAQYSKLPSRDNTR